jgi:signal transduction histidine kinase
MATKALRQQRWVRWSLVFLSAAALGFIWAGLYFLGPRKVPIGWDQALLWGFTSIFVIIIPIPLVRKVVQRFQFQRHAKLRSFLVHICLGVLYSTGISVAAVATETLSQIALGEKYSWLAHSKTSIWDYLGVAIPNHFIFYWLVLGILLAVEYSNRLRARELRELQLEAQLAQAQLHSLKMQLHPHFLFNTLNAIYVLMAKDVEAARQMLLKLSDLLRLALENSSTHEVPLKQELDFLDRYLSIEQIRFRDRLKIKMDIDPEALDAQVPNLLLQPIVENAIRHGIAPRAEPGQIEVKARRENGMLVLNVRDDGPGLASDKPIKEGVGLANTKARLLRLYGSNHRLEFFDIRGEGMRVSIAIPFHREPNSNEQNGMNGHG